jgi:hypothetical protein
VYAWGREIKQQGRLVYACGGLWAAGVCVVPVPSSSKHVRIFNFDLD